jgi:putative ABC transport system ATP-binding protein
MFRNWFGNGRKQAKDDNLYRHGNEHLIELRGVVKEYETAAGPFVALRRIDLSIDKREFVAVVGKSGSGKSTLINMMTGIDKPTHGEVLVGDTAVHTLNENQIAEWRGRNVGVVFQFFQLLPTLTVAENVMLPIARALANDPQIIVADEPTGNLDSKTADAVFQLFATLIDEGKTILMVTHDEDLAHRVTRTVVIADGMIISDDKHGDRSAQQPQPEAEAEGVAAHQPAEIRPTQQSDPEPHRTSGLLTLAK